MKGKYLRKIGGLALTALMLFGIALISSAEAQAQNFAEIYRNNFSRGYQEGYRVGGAERAG